MAIKIDVDVNVNKSFDKGIKKLVKDMEKSLDTIESQAKKLETAIDAAFSNSKTRIEAMTLALKKMEGKEGINQIVFAMNELKKAQMDGTIGIAEYNKKMADLEAIMKRVAIQADVTGKKVKNAGGLDVSGVSNLRSQNISTTAIQKMDVPQLQQSLVILNNQVQVERLKGKALQKNIDLQEVIKNQLKEMNTSSSKRVINEEKAAKAAEKTAEATRRANSAQQLNYAKGLSENSLVSIRTKINELTIAQRGLTQSTEAEKKAGRDLNIEIERLEKKYKDLKNAGTELGNKNKELSNTFGQLGRMAATYFSAYAVKNFAKEVAMVSGEFDLQRRALGALIKDRQKADEIFERIKLTALKSPFSVMELTTYTKQLAAYRVETDKLYDTTYRLADISAGLGVDMGRLILAFGQVKAASVLRGQELRQFTESGIPLVSLLADKFSELEKRAVTTGEVFDKISNRLVPFKMIDEIFQDMTKSGGTFFEMQKIQAETLKGRIVNLTDAYQLMLDKIGSGGVGGGIIRGFISMLEWMLKNFEGLLVVILPLISALGLYKTILFVTSMNTGKLFKISEAWKALQLAMTVVTNNHTKAEIARYAAMKNVNSAFAKSVITNPYAALAAGAIALVAGLVLLIRHQTAFNRELAKIDSKGTKEFNELTEKWKSLTKTIKDSTVSVEKQNNAFTELKNTFKDILPSQLLTIENIKKEKIALDEVTKAIYARISASVKEQKSAKILERYGKRTDDFREQFLSSFSDSKQGEVSAFISDYENLLANVTDASLVYSKKFNDKVLELSNKYGITLKQRTDSVLKLFGGSIISLNKELVQITSNVGAGSNLQKYGSELAKQYEDIQKQLVNIKESFTSQFAESDGTLTFDNEQKLVQKQIAYIRLMILDLQNDTSLYSQKLQEDLKKQIGLLLGSSNRQTMVSEFKKISGNFGLTMEETRKYLREDSQSFEEWSKNINETYDERIKNVKQYETATSFAARAAIFNSKADFDAYKLETEFINKIINLYNIREEKNKGADSKKNPLLNALKEELSLVETLNKRYDELKEKGSTTAKEDTANEYAKNIQEVQKILANQGITFDFAKYIGDKDSLSIALKEQFDRFAGNPDIQKELSESFGRLGIDIKVNNLEQVQKDIEKSLNDIKLRRSLSLEIDQAPSSVRPVLMSLFGIEEKDLLSEIGKVIDAANNVLVKGLTDANITNSLKDFSNLTIEQFRAIIKPIEDSNIAKGLIDVFEFLKSENTNYIKQTASAYEELLKKYADFNDRMYEISYNADKELRGLDEMYALNKKRIEEELNNSIIKDKVTYFKKLAENESNYLKFKEAINNKEQKELARLRYEELKESEAYINMFDRVGIMSEGNMIDAYTKVRQGIVDAFKSGTISLKEFKRSLEELDGQFNEFYKNTTLFGAYLSNGLNGVVKQLQENASQVESIAADIEKMQDTQDPVKFRAMLGEDKINFLKGQGVDVMKLFQGSNGQMSQIASKVGSAAKGMSGMANKMMQTFNIIDMIITNIYNGIKATKQVIDDVIRLREAYGKADKDTTTNFEKWATVISNTNEKVMSSWSKFKSGDPVGALADAISQVLGVFSDLSEIGDKQVEESIEKTKKNIDKLTTSIDRLNDAVDEQMGSDWIATMQQISDYYDKIAQQTQANIDAENSKKNPDEDKLDQYEKDLYDAEQASKDAVERIAEELMGGSVKDMAEELGDIFVSAFLRGENAIEEMQETFNKMIQNMIVKSIVSSIIGKRLEAITQMLDNKLLDGELSEGDIIDLSNLSTDVLAGMTADLEAIKPFLDNIRRILGVGGEMNDTLQKGIKGITEQTASAIESYLNTIRYEVFKHTNILSSIARDISLSRDIQSSILLQAQQHYQVALAIKQWTENITMTNGNGTGIRVFSY